MSVKDNFPALKPSLLLDFANTKVLDPRVTFSRASEARYYDGKTVAKAEENLLTYSEQFDNAAWIKSTVTITANTTIAPDGTSTADTLAASADYGYTSQSITALALPYTFSVWIKRKTGTGTVDIRAVNGSWVAAAVTTDWQRFSVSATPSAGAAISGIRLWVTGDEVYIWGAQLEQRSSITDYTATTTQPITNYIPVLQTAAANVARFDHNPVTGESLGLRVEEQRTNLLLRSQEFDNAYWTKAACAITANTHIAPDGTLTADTVKNIAASGTHFFYRASLTYSAGANTLSIYAKYVNNRWATVQWYDGSASFEASFDMLNGVTGAIDSGATSTITAVGNGWYRLTITATSASGGLGYYSFGLNQTDSASIQSYVATGYEQAAIWGAQLEAGSFATSYIKTEASQVTRSADSASMTGTNFSSWYRADEGALYSEAVSYGITTAAMVATMTDATFANVIDFGRYQNTLVANVFSSSGLQASLSTSLAIGSVNKFAVSYKVNDFVASGNGGVVIADSNGVVPSGIDRFYIGNYQGSNRFLNGCIKKLAYYPIRCTNTQLQALTQQG